MSDRTIFDEIIDGNIPAWKVWEDDNYLAFLTPFANTPGVTVVVPKVNPGGYAFNLDAAVLHGLMDAVTKVAKVLERALKVSKVGMVFEGEAVPHVHAKLYPMHRLETGMAAASVKHQEFYPEYPGYLSTVEGPRMSDEQLNEIQAKIQKATSL